MTPTPCTPGAQTAPAAAPVLAFVSIGSNVEPARHVRLAVSRLRARFGPLAMSGVYRNRAAGFDGEDFLNMVVGFRTAESPQAIMQFIEQLHAEVGRVRGADPFSPRTLDLDLLLYGDQVIDAPQVPRPDITKYSFVLGPLAEIAPGIRHPVTGETMAELWGRFDQASHPIHRLGIALV